MSVLLALDPSMNSAGVALFRDGVLRACARVKSTANSTNDPGQRWVTMAREIVHWSRGDVDRPGGTPSVFVFERPQVYRAGRGGKNPNDLFGLAGVAGAVAALLAHDAHIEIRTYTPAEWIGQIPKTKTVAGALTSVRARRILGPLSLAEHALVPAQHDAVDAVGIGLHSLGRLRFGF